MSICSGGIMEIKPCAEDRISVIGIWIAIIVIEIAVILVSKFHALFVIGIVLLDAVLCISAIRDFIYLSRTVQLDREGCTFSLWRFRKTYQWDSLKVQLCDDRHFTFSDSDVSGPGLLICPKTANYDHKIAAMTFCRKKHPFSSVYLRFETAKDKHPTVTGKIVYYGYTADKAEILNFLRFLL